MQIQVNTGNGIENKESLERWADSELRERVQHFTADITRIEVHLTNGNDAKSGNADKRCTIEARLVHHQPVAVSHHGVTQDEAFRGATEKLRHSLDHTLGRQKNHRDRESVRKADAEL